LQHFGASFEDSTMSMQEYRCQGCGQVFQVVELPGEAPDPVQCPTCQSEDLEHLATLQGAGTDPPETPPE
jgi:putative FmdB family regulatory protein